MCVSTANQLGPKATCLQCIDMHVPQSKTFAPQDLGCPPKSLSTWKYLCLQGSGRLLN